MTKKAITSAASTFTPVQISFHPYRWLCQNPFIKQLSEFYSAVLEEPVTPDRTLRLVHAQAAVCALFVCSTTHLIVTVLLTAWAGLAVYAAKNPRKPE